ncbi:MAG TPA: helix-turn-helix transcriptional regulator [Noviherbaspirillum sp.]|nr:helix-turn-helix transcriptional regulator [Noviherbaspirillum sp.]
MLQTRDWITIEVPEMEALPKAVFPRSQNLAAMEKFPPHSHRWNQFVYATSGTLVVTVADSWHVITPEQAIWVPTGVEHTTGTLDGAQFRNLYVADVPGLGMPAACTVFSVTPLLRALIIELENAGQRNEDEPYVDQLNALIFEQLRRLSALDFHLPWPRSPMLHTLCEALYANPADARSVDDWGRELGASARTLARHFEQEVGISLREWRYRLRLFLALEWLCSERSVTEIALELGYASTSAFTYMFRQEMGCTPSEWRAR